MITSHRKSLILNKQLHMNVPLEIILNKIDILEVHKLRMKQVLIVLAIQHMKQMLHKLTITGKIMQEKYGQFF